MSHDLRAPLAAIRGFGDALWDRAHPRLDERERHLLTRIRAGGARMDELIGALLSLARVTRAEIARQELDLSAMATEITEELREVEQARAVDVRIEPELATTGEPGLVRQLLWNLLSNAWKFTAGNPSARIEVARVQDFFVVRDNGVGFEPDPERLFQPFQRFHKESEFSGTGVGLATVQRIALRHGGTVRVESKPGAGTAVHFSLRPG